MSHPTPMSPASCADIACAMPIAAALTGILLAGMVVAIAGQIIVLRAIDPDHSVADARTGLAILMGCLGLVILSFDILSAGPVTRTALNTVALISAIRFFVTSQSRVVLKALLA